MNRLKILLKMLLLFFFYNSLKIEKMDFLTE